MNENEASDVEKIPEGLRAYRRAAQWLSLTARRDQAGLDRLKEAVGADPDDWAAIATTIAYIAEEQGVARLGTPEAWAKHADGLAATAYAVQWSRPALGALTDQVRAAESGDSFGDETRP